MCGRFLTPDEAAFERHWGIAVPPNYFRSYNLAPTQLAAVIRRDGRGDRTAELLTWGFQPAWAKRAWINARSETVLESRAFEAAARRRRCLVPTLGWYEWQGRKAPKQPFLLHLDGFRPFAFAGIWTARETDEGWLGSFAILTRPATPKLEAIHDRMPLIVIPERYEAWLDRDTDDTTLRGLLDAKCEAISTYPVSTYVNKPANNDAECIRPVHASGH
jgi:putative SOS response-associated peptidase YedK